MTRNILKNTALVSVTALALAAAGSASAVEFKAGHTTFTIYGYAKFSVIYDVDSNLGTFGINNNVTLNRDSSDESTGHFKMQAVESRIGFITDTDTGMGNVRTLIEGDFLAGGAGLPRANAPDNRGNFRVRRAFGEWNGILAGQEWSNFSSFVGVTPALDLFGQIGSGHIARQAQIRYTSGPLSVALEEPRSQFIGGSAIAYSVINDDGDIGSSNAASRSRLPDLTIRLEDRNGNMRYSFAGVARQIGFEGTYLNGDGENANGNDTAFGYGVSFQGKLQLSPGFSIQGGASYGDGISGYIRQAFIFAPAYVDASGRVKTIQVAHGSIGASLAAGPGAINLSYSIAQADVDDQVNDTAATARGTTESIESAHLNYIWSPVRNVSYGIEASYHTRTVQSGAFGDALRLQGMARYTF